MKSGNRIFMVYALFILCFILNYSLNAQRLNKRTGTIFQNASIQMDESLKSPVEIRFQDMQKVTITTFFEQYRKVFAWSEDNEAILFREMRDELDQTHYRYKQHYKGIEVADVQYLLHEEEGIVTYANGKLIHGLDLDVTPVLSEQQALQKALEHIGAAAYMWENKKNEAFLKSIEYSDRTTFYPEGNLKISAGLREHVSENFRLVYRFDIFTERPMSRNYVDVDAKTGDIVGVFPRMYNDDVQGKGTTLYNGEVDITVSDQNYENPDDPPAHFHVNDWNAYGGSGNSWWMADTAIGDNGGYSDGWYEVLDTDPISLFGEQVTLSFRHRFAAEPPSPPNQMPEGYDGWDGFNVRISIDDGVTWQILENPTPIYTNESLYSFGFTQGEGEGIPGWTGILENWTDVTFDLSAYIGYDVRIRFAFAADGGVSTEYYGDPSWFGWQIDDIIVTNLGGALFSNDGIDTGMTATNYLREATIINGNYRLRESGRGGGIATFNAGETSVIWQATDFVDNDSIFSDQEDHVGVSTHWAAEATYDYFLQLHGRNSFDNEGSRIVSYSNFGIDWLNAQWTGSFMLFGGGDASNGYRSLVGADIVGHEFTHGVTQFSAGLIYQNEFGALNESFSDIFGEHIESFATNGGHDWLMGDDSGAIRSFINPNIYGQPDTYLGNFWYTGTSDYGGVHINSGVQNFWFYLLVEGGSGVNDNGDSYQVDAIGWEDAAKIAYRNLTVYLTPTSEHEEARRGSLKAAGDLFGSASQQFNAVLNAWNAVGVYYPFFGPYPENTTINGDYFIPGHDSLIVQSSIVNPNGHELEVKTIIRSFDSAIEDTLLMYDDGLHYDIDPDDGIWGEVWPIPSGERHYTLHIKTVSLDSGYSNLQSDVAQFTTIGPLKFVDHFDEELILGVFSQRFLFKVRLQNFGKIANAENIGATVRILNEDNCFTMAAPYREFSDIAPGETIDGTQAYSVLLDTTCLNDGKSEITFIIDVASDGYVFWTDTFNIDIIATDIISDFGEVPGSFDLSQNYPNPFNPVTIIDYQLPMNNEVNLSVYNSLGQKVVTLINKQQRAGSHQVEWDASGYASGVYYYRLSTSSGFVQTKKFVLIR